MAITDIAAYAHLTSIDVEALSAELDEIRRDIERSRGQRDADYIHRAITVHRALEIAARLALAAARNRAAWTAGTLMLAAAKTIEMMELGHNVMHGQWDWMNDPEIHSTTWEWDLLVPSSQWKRAHNHIHHTYTNVHGMDEDLGFSVLRMTRDDAAETRSERKFHATTAASAPDCGAAPMPTAAQGSRRGLRTALAATASRKNRRRSTRPPTDSAAERR